MTSAGILPSGDKVEVGQLTIRKSVDIEKTFKNQDDTEILIEKIAYSIKKVNDVDVDYKKAKEFVENLTANDFACLAGLWNSINGVNKDDFENFLMTVTKTV